MNIDLNKLLELAGKATPGPWHQEHRKCFVDNDGDEVWRTQVFTADGAEIATLAWYPKRTPAGTGTYRADNAAYLAAAHPAVITELVNMLKQTRKELEQVKEITKLNGNILNDYIVTMQSAVIEAEKNGDEQGMTWIWNTLSGPGLIPSEDDEWVGDPQLYYNHHRSNPFGPCGVCGKPSSMAQAGKVACCDEHLQEQLSGEGGKQWAGQNDTDTCETVKLVVEQLNGAKYPLRISSELAEQAKAAGLVIVYGASDDLMEFAGAIYDELGVYDGGTALVDTDGLLSEDADNLETDEDRVRYYSRKGKAKTIEALWCKEPGYSWTYSTEIPHETFEVVEDGEPYCRGIVFALANAGV